MEKEEQLFRKRIQELAENAYSRDIPLHTDFLTLAEQTVFQNMSATLPPVKFVLSGGFPMSERKVLCFLASYEEEKPRFLPRATNNNKVVPMRRGNGMEVSLIKPTSLDDAKEICDYLLAGKAVVLNMEGIHTETAQRIIDFTSGSTYSMNGNLQKISNYIFIATPQSVELSGDFQDLLTGGNLDVSGLNIHL